jgi:cytochrome P450
MVSQQISTVTPQPASTNGNAMPSARQEMISTVIDPKAHADPRRLHAAFAWLRANDPLALAELPGFDPFRLVTKHADILEVSRDNTLFPYGDYPSTLAPHEAVERGREARKAGRPLLYTLVQMDEPDHLKYRALTQAWFMPQNIRKLEDRIRELARDAVARMEALGGTCDFVDEVALHFPLHVIMQILGVPREDEPRMLKLTQELFGATDPDLRREGTAMTPEGRELDIQATLADFFNYFNALTEDRRARPRDDVASTIANATIDGRPISAFDAVSYYLIVATAGHDTTSSSTAGAMWALAERPGEFAKVRDNPGHPGPGGRVHPLDDARAPLHAQRGGRHGAARPGDRQGRLADAVLSVRQPRRGGVRGPHGVPRRPQPQPPPGVRLRRPPVPGPAPGQDGNAHPVGGTAAQVETRRAGRRGETLGSQFRQRPQDVADPIRVVVSRRGQPSTIGLGTTLLFCKMTNIWSRTGIAPAP